MRLWSAEALPPPLGQQLSVCYLLRIMHVFIKMSALDFICRDAAAAEACSGLVMLPFLADILRHMCRQEAPKPHTENEPKVQGLWIPTENSGRETGKEIWVWVPPSLRFSVLVFESPQYRCPSNSALAAVPQASNHLECSPPLPLPLRPMKNATHSVKDGLGSGTKGTWVSTLNRHWLYFTS